jgi:outer membrane immunogenic protein
MRSVLVVAAAVVVVTTVAGSAADLALKAPIPVPVSNWTGCYLGAHGGYGWSRDDVSYTPLNNALTEDVNPGAVSFNSRGAVFGGQIGCNWQTATNWVLGLEGDLAAASITGKTMSEFTSLLNSGGLDSFTATTNITGLATIRGRAGYSWGPGMVYVTGGGAWERLEVATNLASNAAPGAFATQGPANVGFDRWGYAVGAGVEYMIAPHWTLRGEYLYYNFSGSNAFQSITAPCGGGTCTTNHSIGGNSINEVRFGVNYLFSLRQRRRSSRNLPLNPRACAGGSIGCLNPGLPHLDLERLAQYIAATCSRPALCGYPARL